MLEAITVTKLNTYIKQIFDAEELLHNISVIGEVFGISTSRNTLYFSLKDENSSLPCVCFYPNIFGQIQEGDKLIVTGSPNFYIKGGKLTFNVNKVEKVGQGQLYEEFLKLKEKLQKEGLFEISHKKPIPKNIRRIGVITSKEGAVIQDIKNVAWRRNPSVDIVLFNTKVQGNNSENEIAHAIEKLGNYPNIDVIVVARGGGSLEDLWAYNTEIVARATYNCPKPIISAVGHETDFTIIDFVSDLRAPTPSAAAELLTFNLADKKNELSSLYDLLNKTVKNYISSEMTSFSYIKTKLINSLNQIIYQEEAKFKHNSIKLTNDLENLVHQKYYELGLIETTLNKINPKLILQKGYAKIEQEGKSINSLKTLDLDNNLSINFYDGNIDAKPIKKK